ncbi:synaptonemal complex protein 2-like isoform X2 [Hyla sarda]|uniref:synaptonemal complex protein 2-like isoform X2 n=1 Tax=Hyla sarda TaxID=327740 RepID=UPI0024C360E6|nr:synaptonemal complex protein 2-like isoform X2 [Hyla sarda]
MCNSHITVCQLVAVYCRSEQAHVKPPCSGPSAADLWRKIRDEDKRSPGEKMNIQTEYYLETLIIDASKGKGFWKISELVEDKAACSSQKHSKGLLNQLDRLINKELDRNEFKHVSLLLKCIQHFCLNGCHEGWSLIQQGLVSKMVLWFERTLEFLMICKDHSTTISALVEQFYDTALVICKCNTEDGVNQLLDTFLYNLGFIILENWPPFSIKLEALKTFNFILGQTSREEKKNLISSEKMCTLMQDLARKLFEVGDYEIQVAITEALCRLTSKKMRDNFAQKWFEDPFFADAFQKINDKDFETDCRKFLNSLNSKINESKRVHTFPCISVSTDVDELRKPQDDKLEQFWIDFNVCSQIVSFYIQNNEASLWDSVRIQKECLSGYSLEECNGQKLLCIHLKIPLSINNKAVKYIKMHFELEHNIQNAAVKTYGEDLQMEVSGEVLILPNDTSSTGTSDVKSVNDNQQKGIQSSNSMDGGSVSTLYSPSKETSSATKMHPKSPQHTDRSNKLKAGLTDLSDGVSSEEEISGSVAHDKARVLEISDDGKLSEDSGKNLIVTTSETKGKSPKQAVDIYQFPKSSESASDIEVSVVKDKVLIPVASSIRKNNPKRPGSLSCQKTDAKKDVDYKDFLSSGSEMSWILEHRRKSSAKCADYSRKKQKSKSRLKVLPLSSQSSDETEKLKKRGQHLKFTDLKKETGQERGVAESLSFSDVKLPGVSALLTPRDSLPHTAGTLRLSDLDQDTMDPLQEMSSPELVKIKKLPETSTTSKINVESNKDQIELIEGLYPSGIAENFKKKRKRPSCEREEEIYFKPRKLFTSAKASADLEDDVFKSDSHESDITEGSFISSFESFTEGLKKKMMTRYKNMEVRAQDVLKTSHLHVSKLMNQIQQSNFRKLNHFSTIVAQELSSLEAETQALKELEKETLDFWEAQTVKVNEFCTNQQQRIEAMDHTIAESLKSLKKKEESTTDVQKL